MLHGITPAGGRYIETLQLNRAPLVSHQRADRRAEQAAERDRSLNERLDQIMARIERIEAQTRARRGR